MAFPTTGILDDFNRANEGPPPSAAWSANGAFGGNSMLVESNALRDSGSSNGANYGTQYGPDTEVYITLSVLPADNNRLHLFLRGTNSGGSGEDGYWIDFTRLDANPGFSVKFFRMDNQSITQLGSTFNDTSGVMAAGIKFGVDMVGTTLTAYVNRAGSWSAVTSTSGDATYTLAGYIGLAFDDTTTRGDDFGGGSVATPAQAAAVPITVNHGSYW